MKQLLLGVVLLVLIGIAGFFYRNAIEAPGPVVACPLDAKLCADGSSVGRVLPTCEFAACPTTQGAVSYTMPAGYTVGTSVDASVRDTFVKPSLSGTPSHTITVREYAIPEGQTANDVIIANTIFYPSDMPAESMDQFDPLTVNGKTYQSVVIERFEAIVHSAYYLPLEGKVLKFEIVEHDVTDWMEPILVVNTLPEHAALIQMLGTVAY